MSKTSLAMFYINYCQLVDSIQSVTIKLLQRMDLQGEPCKSRQASYQYVDTVHSNYMYMYVYGAVHDDCLTIVYKQRKL